MKFKIRGNRFFRGGGGGMRAALAVLMMLSAFLVLPPQAEAQLATLSVSNKTPDSVTLTFSDSSAAWYYASSNNPSGTCSNQIPAGTTTATVTGLDADTSYTYLAYSDSGCATRSSESLTFKTTQLNISNVTGISATLTFKNRSDAWSYKLDQEGAQCKSVAGGTTTASLSGLQRGTTHRYYAYGSSSCGTHIASVEFQTTVPTGRPLALSGVSGSSGPAQLTTTWTKPSNGWNIEQYCVYYRKSSTTLYTSECTYGSSVTSITISNLDTNTTYYRYAMYYAIADDKNVNSSRRASLSSSPEIVQKPKVVPPDHSDPVAGLQVTANSPKRLAASWTAASGASGYDVKLSKGVFDVHAKQVTKTSWESGVDLDVGVTYTISVRAKKGADKGPWSSETGVPLAAGPGKVTGVSVTPVTREVGVGQLSVSWSALTGANGYKMQWKSGAQNWDESARQNTVTTTSSTITGLTAGTTYTVRVIATKTNAFDGTPSDNVTGIPYSQAPGKVAGVSATAPSRGASNLGKLEVEWDTFTGATGFHVQWKSSAQNWSSSRQNTLTTGSATDDTITGLANGTTYTVRVRATHENAETAGQWSDQATGTTNAGPPARVTGVTLTPGVETLTASWSAVTDVTGYKVQWKSGTQDWDTSTRQNTATGTSHTIQSLTSGTTHTVRVTAYNADGDGTPSLLKTGIPKDTAPAQVTGVSVMAGTETEQLSVSWSAVTGASGYKVQWKSRSQSFSSSRQDTVSGGSTTSYTIMILTDITAYTVQVRATKTNADDGTWSNTATGTPNAPLPGQVTGVTLTTPAASQIKVSWNSVSEATGYKVQWKSGSENFDSSKQNTVTSGTTTTSTITGLTAETEYTVRVIATRSSALGDGPPSNEVKETAKHPKPDTVTGVTLTSGIEEIKVEWNPVANATLGYKVQWKSGSESFDSSKQNTVTSGTTTFEIIGLNAGTYQVRVAAMMEHAVSDGDWSDMATGAALPQPTSAPAGQGSTPGGTPPAPEPPDDDSCPDYTPYETAADVEKERDPDTLVEFVQEASVGVKSILGEETEQSEAASRLAECYGVNGEENEANGDWISGSAYLFVITDQGNTSSPQGNSGLGMSAARVTVSTQTLSSKEGTQLNLADENGCDVTAEIIRAARGEQLQCEDLGLLPEGEAEGFVQYLWDNPADPNDDSAPGYEDRGDAPGNSPKLSYVEEITDEGLLPDGVSMLILGSGYYPNWDPPGGTDGGGGGTSSGGDGGGGCAVAGERNAAGSAALGLFLIASVLLGVSLRNRSRGKRAR